jgi:fused signal recognition particle receptor
MADLFGKWKEALTRTRKSTFGQIATFLGATEINDATWDELEALLLQADVGLETATDLIDSLKSTIKQQGITKSDEFDAVIHTELMKHLLPPPPIDFGSQKPVVILLVGVNGSGKTTTAAKLGKWFANQGNSVLLGAADTYRAAAVDQLAVWADRLKLPIIFGQPNADPGAVAFDAVQSAISRKFDILLVDTAGRLHTRFNLMEELKKVSKVVAKALPGAPHATWLVIDATTGQNALLQSKAFKEAVKVDGIILAKLDTSAKGGMAFAIQKELGLPILFAGLGETVDDLQPFSPESFVNGILGK